MVTAGTEGAHVVLRNGWMMLRCIRGGWRKLAVGISVGGAMPGGCVQDGYRIVFGDGGAVWQWCFGLGYGARCNTVRRWAFVLWREVAAACGWYCTCTRCLKAVQLCSGR